MSSGAGSVEHHSVVIIGGGPGGLGVAAVLAGWRPRLRNGFRRFENPDVQRIAEQNADDLMSADLHAVLKAGVRPIDFFRTQHHPRQGAVPLDERPLQFYRDGGLESLTTSGFESLTTGGAVDWLLLTLGLPGGLWNGVPRHQLTLSPAHWMELAPYPMLQFAADSGRAIHPDALILKDDLVAYYHAAPGALGLDGRIRVGVTVTCVRPPRDGEPGRFAIETTEDGSPRTFTCDNGVFAVGPRSAARRLGVPGEDLPYVSHYYDHPDACPGGRVLVVGGGRSADWAATELHDAGRHVAYVMRQPVENHLRLIAESQHLPYYLRIAQIMQGSTGRFGLLYGSHVRRFLPGGVVEVASPEGEVTLRVDHVVVEIGADPDYSLLQGFPPLTFVPKRDNYRFQLMQVRVDQATFESVDVPGLYVAGYLAEGTGLSVIGFHCGAYLIGADILRGVRGEE